MTKLNASGNALVYSTYLGGGTFDEGTGIATDSSGNAYVTGATYSTTFPLQNAFQSKLRGPQDAFVTKFNASGSALVYSTYLGGSNDDGGSSIAVDQAGEAYVTGTTTSTDFPLQNPFQSTNGDLQQAAFVTKFSAAGNTLVYSTYLHGSRSDFGKGIAVDRSGHAYVTGSTISSDFPLKNPFQSKLRGIQNAFVTKFTAAGNALVYSSYLGGSNMDEGTSIAVDSAGFASLTGTTDSTDFPLASPLQSYGGQNDAFVARVNPTGSALSFSTYLGGSQDDDGFGIAVDKSGNAYVAGGTSSADFPIRGTPFQPDLQGQPDAFLTKINIGLEPQPPLP